MPRRKSANEMNDREIMEKAFSPRVVRELEREYDLRTDEKDDDTGSHSLQKESTE